MILVTGATGLVGSHLLVKLLQENEAVKAIYRNKKSLEAVQRVFVYHDALPLFEKIIWVKADITDIPSLNNAFENVTEVYHCAAHISFDPKDENLLRKINEEGTANIVNCCIDFGVRKICHVSSIAALGDLKENETVITEETEWNTEFPHSDYAITKYGAEMEVWRGYQEGLEVVIVNPGIIFGYGFPDKGSSLIIKNIKKGFPFYSKGLVAIVAVADVVDCMTALMKSTINGERYTLVSENISQEELFYTLADLLKVKRPYVYANKTLTAIGWRLDWFLSFILGKKRMFTKTMAKSSHNTHQYDNSKIKQTLGYDFKTINEIFTFISKEDYCR
ncbi:NAD-dependent epimerase/dehydratase family protein [Flavobacterium sp. NRK F10]|uniref:NAD-dependent epimerase/dehydratase family protein n=1 Tax=Flavobacterium sp. NRK F10 TaxID=2954931 RepID=UPI002090E538|nr:NAD-dependent epimerase/dehydratase family protein [Flavobacterium sp. NRK F10]MCO6175010.1 NAD-dependent epimerase/dehydratase family protein [Flavobacterium sp. NRK F10]